MKVNKVNTIFKRVVQMRQFEPAEVSVSIEAQVDPGDKPETVLANIKRMARLQVEEEMTRLKTERKENYDSELEKSI